MTQTTKKGATVIQAPAPAPLRKPVDPTRPISVPKPAEAPTPIRIDIPVPEREKVPVGK